MRIASWNCRGMGNGPAVRGLLDFQRQEDPDVLFLCETKMKERNICRFKWLLGMQGMVARDCEGRSGGIVLFWKKEVNISLGSFSRYHIDVKIEEEDGFKWRFTGIYGEPAVEKRGITWRLMHILKQQNNLPWLCMSFNEIMFSHEKKGGAPRPQNQMDKFRWIAEECGLRDLGFRGDKYTWRNNSWDPRKFVKERLDRALGTSTWCKRFQKYTVINGDQRHSDHRPVIMVIGEEKRRHTPREDAKFFRFEAKWLQEEGREQIVKEAWNKS
jgi:exonuclease III